MNDDSLGWSNWTECCFQSIWLIKLDTIEMTTHLAGQELRLGLSSSNSLILVIYCVSFDRRAFQLCGDAEGSIAANTFQMELDVEGKVLQPLNYLLEVDVPSIQKLRKQLTSRTLDMDAAKTRLVSELVCYRNCLACHRLSLII